ncbi:response regulator [candidate division KSB1 bacterium]|nr:response regulator [candidate division KSB1 bacterium]
MNRRSILIIDKDPNNQKVLQNNFIESGYEVDVAADNSEALKLLQLKPFDAVLSELAAPGIDGFNLLENTQKASLNVNIPVVFLTQKNDIWNRVKSLKLGAKDYIVKPIHVKELIARLNMLLSRIERKSTEENIIKKKFAGKLKDISLFDLIKVFGLEKKTGVLSLINENGFSGQIFFENGNIINAGTLAFKGVDAVYKMMTWDRGRFSMHFCDIDVIDEIKVSNLAILLQGAMRMEKREEILKQLPSLDTVLTTTSNFKKITSKQDLASNLQYFLELFDGKRTLKQIINDSQEDEITTLKRILQLNQLGFLTIVKEKSAHVPAAREEEIESSEYEDSADSLFKNIINETDSESINVKISNFYQEPVKKVEKVIPDQKSKADETKHETQKPASAPVRQAHITPKTQTWAAQKKITTGQLKTVESSKVETLTEKKQPVSPHQKAKGTILILGTDNSVRKNIVENLIVGRAIESRVDLPNVSEIYFGTARFKGEQYLNITTFSMEKEFTPLLEYFAPSTLGYILLIDIKNANWNYFQYLLNVLRGKLSVPSVIVISNKTSDSNEPSIDDIRSKLLLKNNQKIVFCSNFDKPNSKKLIFSLFKNYFKK